MNHDQTATTKPHKENQSRAKLGLKSRKSSRLPTYLSKGITPTITRYTSINIDIVTLTWYKKTDINIIQKKRRIVIDNPSLKTKEEKDQKKKK